MQKRLISIISIVLIATLLLGILPAVHTVKAEDEGTVLKAMTGLSVFSFGLVLTAVLSFIYWIIKRSRVYTEE